MTPLAMARRVIAPRWLPMTALIVLLMAVFVRLGVWQLDRLEERRAANAALAAQLAATPLDLNEAWPADPSAAVNTQATATGSFDLSWQMRVKLQSLDGRPGAHLVAPLLLGDGRAVLVHRGWVADEDSDPYDPVGPVTVEGVLQPSERLPRTAAATETRLEPDQREIFRVDISALQAIMPYELLPVYLLQAPEASPPAGASGPIRLAPDIDLSEGPHLSYAIQWFAFAVMAPVFYVILLRRHDATPEDGRSSAANDSHRP